jgi:hypothetical protein
MTQLEMPWLMALKQARWVDQAIVDSWTSYREAVMWCWENRPKRGKNDPQDQRMAAYYLGCHPPHFSRYVNPKTKSPMDLPPDMDGAFQGYTGWRGIDQYNAKRKELTIMEEVIWRKTA